MENPEVCIDTTDTTPNESAQGVLLYLGHIRIHIKRKRLWIQLVGGL